MPPRLGSAAASVNDHFGIEVFRASAPNPCLGGWEHLQRVFQNLRSGLPASRQGPDVAPPRESRTAPHQRRWETGRTSFPDAPTPARARQVHGAMRPAGSVSTKNESQAVPPAEAPIRHCRPDHPYAELILARSSNHPSRSRHRKAIAGDSFFPASGRGAVDLTGPRRRIPTTIGSSPCANQIRWELTPSVPSVASWDRFDP
jgi:hypothetical protein